MTSSPQELLLGTRITGDFVVLAPEERRRQLYIVGQTGTGKLTLLLNLLAQDGLHGFAPIWGSLHCSHNPASTGGNPSGMQSGTAASPPACFYHSKKSSSETGHRRPQWNTSRNSGFFVTILAIALIQRAPMAASLAQKGIRPLAVSRKAICSPDRV